MCFCRQDGTTALHCAVGNGYSSCVSFLLNKKADVNADTIVRQIFSKLYIRMKEIFLLSFCDVLANFLAAQDGRSPLHLSATHNYQSIALILLRSKADIDARDEGVCL